MFELTPQAIGVFIKTVGIPIACLIIVIWVFFSVVSMLIKMINSLTDDAKADRDRFRADYKEIEQARKHQQDEWLNAIKKIHDDSRELHTSNFRALDELKDAHRMHAKALDRISQVIVTNTNQNTSQRAQSSLYP